MTEVRDEGILVRPDVTLPENECQEQFIERLNSDYAALRCDAIGWQEVLEERQVLDGTLLDGLDPDERWTDDGGVWTT